MMRQLVAAAATGLGLLLATSANAATPNISGDWKIQGEIQSGRGIVSATPTCTFVQSAAGKLSGSCVGPNASGPLAGYISGNNVSWTWRNIPTTSIGVNGETGFKGTYVDAHLIRGVMTSTSLPGAGTFTQTR
jgi:hypothetical protein